MAARINNDICVESAIRAPARGEFVVVVDDEDRENEGDLVCAAEQATPEKVAFLLQHTSGFLRAAIAENRAKELQLDLMVENTTENQRRRPRESVSGAGRSSQSPRSSCPPWSRPAAHGQRRGSAQMPRPPHGGQRGT